MRNSASAENSNATGAATVTTTLASSSSSSEDVSPSEDPSAANGDGNRGRVTNGGGGCWFDEDKLGCVSASKGNSLDSPWTNPDAWRCSAVGSVLEATKVSESTTPVSDVTALPVHAMPPEMAHVVVPFLAPTAATDTATCSSSLEEHGLLSRPAGTETEGRKERRKHADQPSTQKVTSTAENKQPLAQATSLSQSSTPPCWPCTLGEAAVPCGVEKERTTRLLCGTGADTAAVAAEATTTGEAASATAHSQTRMRFPPYHSTCSSVSSSGHSPPTHSPRPRSAATLTSCSVLTDESGFVSDRSNVTATTTSSSQRCTGCVVVPMRDVGESLHVIPCAQNTTTQAVHEESTTTTTAVEAVPPSRAGDCLTADRCESQGPSSAFSARGEQQLVTASPLPFLRNRPPLPRSSAGTAVPPSEAEDVDASALSGFSISPATTVAEPSQATAVLCRSTMTPSPFSPLSSPQPVVGVLSRGALRVPSPAAMPEAQLAAATSVASDSRLLSSLVLRPPSTSGGRASSQLSSPTLTTVLVSDPSLGATPLVLEGTESYDGSQRHVVGGGCTLPRLAVSRGSAMDGADSASFRSTNVPEDDLVSPPTVSTRFGVPPLHAVLSDSQSAKPALLHTRLLATFHTLNSPPDLPHRHHRSRRLVHDHLQQESDAAGELRHVSDSEDGVYEEEQEEDEEEDDMNSPRGCGASTRTQPRHPDNVFGSAAATAASVEVPSYTATPCASSRGVPAAMVSAHPSLPAPSALCPEDEGFACCLEASAVLHSPFMDSHGLHPTSSSRSTSVTRSCAMEAVNAGDGKGTTGTVAEKSGAEVGGGSQHHHHNNGFHGSQSDPAAVSSVGSAYTLPSVMAVTSTVTSGVRFPSFYELYHAVNGPAASEESAMDVVGGGDETGNDDAPVEMMKIVGVEDGGQPVPLQVADASTTPLEDASRMTRLLDEARPFGWAGVASVVHASPSTNAPPATVADAAPSVDTEREKNRRRGTSHHVDACDEKERAYPGPRFVGPTEFTMAPSRLMEYASTATCITPIPSSLPPCPLTQPALPRALSTSEMSCGSTTSSRATTGTAGTGIGLPATAPPPPPPPPAPQQSYVPGTSTTTPTSMAGAAAVFGGTPCRCEAGHFSNVSCTSCPRHASAMGVGARERHGLPMTLLSTLRARQTPPLGREESDLRKEEHARAAATRQTLSLQNLRAHQLQVSSSLCSDDHLRQPPCTATSPRSSHERSVRSLARRVTHSQSDVGPLHGVLHDCHFLGMQDVLHAVAECSEQDLHDAFSQLDESTASPLSGEPSILTPAAAAAAYPCAESVTDATDAGHDMRSNGHSSERGMEVGLPHSHTQRRVLEEETECSATDLAASPGTASSTAGVIDSPLHCVTEDAPLRFAKGGTVTVFPLTSTSMTPIALLSGASSEKAFSPSQQSPRPSQTVTGAVAAATTATDEQSSAGSFPSLLPRPPPEAAFVAACSGTRISACSPPSLVSGTVVVDAEHASPTSSRILSLDKMSPQNVLSLAAAMTDLSLQRECSELSVASSSNASSRWATATRMAGRDGSCDNSPARSRLCRSSVAVAAAGGSERVESTSLGFADAYKGRAMPRATSHTRVPSSSVRDGRSPCHAVTVPANSSSSQLSGGLGVSPVALVMPAVFDPLEQKVCAMLQFDSSGELELPPEAQDDGRVVQNALQQQKLCPPSSCASTGSTPVWRCPSAVATPAGMRSCFPDVADPMMSRASPETVESVTFTATNCNGCADPQAPAVSGSVRLARCGPRGNCGALCESSSALGMSRSPCRSWTPCATSATRDPQHIVLVVPRVSATGGASHPAFSLPSVTAAELPGPVNHPAENSGGCGGGICEVDDAPLMRCYSMDNELDVIRNLEKIAIATQDYVFPTTKTEVFT